jgi:hypothetical protein
MTKPTVTELTDTFFELFAYSDITWDGQSADWQAEEQLSSLTNLRVRYRIHHDLSYSRQSHAIAQVWSTATMSWNEIASYPAGLWASAADWTGTGGRPVKPGATGHPTYGMAEAMTMLRQRVGDVLAVL